MSADRPPYRLSSAVAAVVLLALPLAATPVHAAAANAPPNAETAQEFLDTRVPALLEEYGAPGAVVGVVADGEQVASGGYGHADRADETPFQPETAVPTASVAKSFTTVAVLQLAEQGRVDLHEDVNTYLPGDARLADTFPEEPVTLHHLLTHTAGFEDSLSETASTTGEEPPTLADSFSGTDVERVQPPGRFITYSNHGMALAGYVVEEVSGVAFEEYAQTEIFDPLDMGTTSFGRLDEARELHDIPTGHLPDGSPAVGLQHTRVPAGSAVTTVDDMSRFMLALLHGGRVDEERVLSQQSATAMLAQQESADHRVSGAGYGTWELRYEAPRVVGHAGDLPGMTTAYALVPAHDTGVFVAVNSEGTGNVQETALLDVRSALVQEFLAEFAPTTEAPIGVPEPGADLERYTGTYVDTRISYNEPSQVRAILSHVRVQDRGDGSLTVRSLSPMPDDIWLPDDARYDAGHFVTENGEDQMLFVEEGGEVVALAFDSDPATTFERASARENPVVHTWAAAFLLAVLLSVLVWPVVTLVRRLRGRGSGAPRAGTWARLVATATAVCCLGQVAALALTISDTNALYTWLFGDSPLLGLPLAAAVPCAVATLVYSVTAWWNKWWSVAGRLHYSLVALAGPAFVAIGVVYNVVWPLS